MNSELIGLLLEDFKNRLENSVSQFIKYKGFLLVMQYFQQ